MTPALVSIYAMTGSSSSKSYQQVYEEIRMTLVPASNETMAFYENAPVGQMYEFQTKDQAVTDIPDQSKIVVSVPEECGLTENDSLVTIGKSQRIKLGGKFIIQGVCVLGD
jgi:hypothetical protein